MPSYLTQKTSSSTPLILLNQKSYKGWLASQPARTKKWLKLADFKAAAHSYALLPGNDGGIDAVLAGMDDEPNLWSLAHLPEKLPAGNYAIEGKIASGQYEQFALGWALASYEFTRYRKPSKNFATLALPASVDIATLESQAQAVHWVRDLINTPTNDMGPDKLAAECQNLAKQHKAAINIITGDALLKQNYPTIHAVGRASATPPRLVDIRWGRKGLPRVTLVGKGVCFDSGGLDIKSAAGMKLMKKDMAGAAIMLGLARMIMDAKLGVQLRVLVPAVENSVSGNAFRPLDIIKTRKGITVEIDNTDAEGRLILCDALAEADDEKPDLLIDCATLTGAARVALGTEIPAFFTHDDKLASALMKSSEALYDPVWRLPLWKPYKKMLTSQTADMMNSSDSGYAGAITAALYLDSFVTQTKSWLHVDAMAWNLSSKPGRPAGGEAMSIRALFDLIKLRYN